MSAPGWGRQHMSQTTLGAGLYTNAGLFADYYPRERIQIGIVEEAVGD